MILNLDGSAVCLNSLGSTPVIIATHELELVVPLVIIIVSVIIKRANGV